MLEQTVWDKPSGISCWCRSNDSEICIINWLLHVACYWLNPSNPEPVLSLKPVQLCNTIDLSVFNYCQLVVSPYCPANLAFFLGQSRKIAGVRMHRTDWLAVCVELLCFVGLLCALCWALTFCSALSSSLSVQPRGRQGVQGPVVTPDMGCLAPGSSVAAVAVFSLLNCSVQTYLWSWQDLYSKESSAHPYRIVVACQRVGLCYVFKTTTRMEQKM